MIFVTILVIKNQKQNLGLQYLRITAKGSQYQICRSTGSVHPTVQNSVETALKYIFNLDGERPIIARFCSRTDSGVHALKAALHVDLPQLGNRFLNPWIIKHKLNKHFIKTCSIRILEVIPVPDSFHVQRACLSKTYFYRVGVLKKEFLANGAVKVQSTPVTEIERTHFILNQEVNFEKAEEAAQLFVGEKDFAALGRKPNHNTRPTVCKILSFTVEKAQPQMPYDHENEKFEYYHFLCTGTRFLFHMVRAMVGAVLSVGMGKTSLDEVKLFFEKPEPSSWLTKIVVVPGHGLYLADTILDPKQLIMDEGQKDEAENYLQKAINNEKLSSAEAA